MLKVLQSFSDMLFYIELKLQVNRSSLRDYFKWLNLLDEFYQICLSGPSSTFGLYLEIQKELLRFLSVGK
jgi:hypothetical protein